MRLFVLILPLLLTACAAPAPVITPEPEEPEETGPAFTALRLQGEVIAGDEGTVMQGVQAVRGVFAGPVETLFALSTGDSTHLYSTSAPEAPVYGVAGDAVFTVAWAADGTSAGVGHYLPAGEASQGRERMGAGDILVYAAGAVSRVGCSASRAVLAWSSDGGLLVRNTDNLYVVDRDGCDTRATVDARRMLRLTVSPNARHLAFVHRELEYDRASRSYVADSTFRLTDLDGGNPKTIVSFRYRPERLAWRPDGLELAFDVQASDDAGRAISIFDVASGTTAFLHPPASDRDEWAPHWSPDAARIAYYRGSEPADRAIWVRTFSSSFPEGLPDSEGAEIAAWVDADALMYFSAEGALRVYDFRTRQTTDLGPADAVIEARRR
ncbi:MAG: hypothetical protein JJ896_04800 [Rhodothermales bacterium]|nr:hypothetical protein [Rhodothermales bacterium]MBO6778952.1 hypothetical protein [Rhodothermales bacterium]